MDFGISGKRALVLASSQGLGLGVATKLCEEGARVLLSSRSAKKLQEAATTLTENGSGTASYVVADLADPTSAESLYVAANAELGGVDILVNNTGGPPPGSVQDPDADGWRAQLDTMLVRIIELTNYCVADMRAAGWGRILTITSSGVIQPIPGIAMSNTIRASLVGWNKSLSNEVARYGITANILAPGSISTARLESLTAMDAEDAGISVAEAEAEAFRKIPAARFGTVEEFGAVGAFLCSAPASYVTGGIVRCDGGAIRSV